MICLAGAKPPSRYTAPKIASNK
ncbi:hypothetical protein CP8484711_0796A, partial [Chlamydia psittaci 84-8471/1]